MGVTKGWWLFNDDFRISTPLLSCELWQQTLLKGGFILSKLFSLSENADAALILAAKAM